MMVTILTGTRGQTAGCRLHSCRRLGPGNQAPSHHQQHPHTGNTVVLSYTLNDNNKQILITICPLCCTNMKNIIKTNINITVQI